MYVISSFEHSTYLELALSELENNGIKSEQILAVPLKQKLDQKRLFDTINRSDGVSMFDAAAILGTIFSVIGVIYGFVLTLGPIIWGLIGLITGLIIGVALKIIIHRQVRTKKITNNRATEVVVIVECSSKDIGKVEEILWSYYPLGVATVDS